MVNLASSISARNKFLIFGGGFSGDYFAKEIRKHGCIALTSSRSRKDDPNSFIFDSERNLIPDHDIFDGTTHILSCIPPTKEGLDPVLQKIKKKNRTAFSKMGRLFIYNRCIWRCQWRLGF